MFYLLLFPLFAITHSQNLNLPSVILPEHSLNDSITQIFNYCKCVIFYLCDEQNVIIPPGDVNDARVPPNYPLRQVKRLKCDNELYYCCSNRTNESTTVPLVPITTPSPTSIHRREVTCGKGLENSPRISNTFPWLVAIYQKNRNNELSNFKCGGTLIHSRVVLTAQHCVRSATAKTLKVLAKREMCDQSERTTFFSEVTKVIKHESYYSGGLYNDIALLILENSLNNTVPVCLPSFNQNFNMKRCTAVGWGKAKGTRRRLHRVDLPVVDSQRCQSILRNTPLGINFELHPSFVCAGGEGSDSRGGEGGGPLMCKDGDRYVQLGIISWGIENCEVNPPSLYTSVPYLVNWVEQKLNAENLEMSRY